MAERIKGLSIGLDLNSAGMDRKLGTIKRSFRDLNSGLKTSMNNFKYTEKSTESYEQAIGDLTKTIGGQRKNVDDLKRKYDELVDSGRSHTAEASKIRQEYNKQADNLNMLETQLDKTKQGLKSLSEEQRIASSRWTKLGNAAETAGNKMQGIGDGLKNIGGKLSMGLTAPLLGGFAAVTKGTEEFRGDLATLETNAKNAGIGVDVIRDSMTRLAGVSTETDSNVEALSNLLATGFDEKGLTKTMDLLSGAVVKFPDTLKIEGLADGLQETLATGKAIGPFAELLERLGVDMDKFNGGLSDAIANGTEQNFVMQTLADNGLANVNQKFRENNKELVESRQSQQSFQQAMADLGTTLAPIATRITQGITGIVEKFNNLSPAGQRMGLIFAGIAAALGPVIGSVGAFVGLLGGWLTMLSPILTKMGEKGFLGVIRALATRFSFLLGPVGIAIGVITTLGTVFGIAYSKSSTFRNMVQGLIERFRNFIPTIIAFGQSIYTNFMTIITPAIQSVKRFFVSMFQQIALFWRTDGQQTINAFMNGVNILRTIISAVLPIITTIFRGVFTAVLFIVRSVWTNIKGVIQGGLNIIMGIIRVFSGLFTGDFSKMWQGIKQIFRGAIQFVWNFVQLMFYGKIIKGGLAFIRLFTSSLRSMWSNIVGFFKSFATSAWTNTKNIFTSLYKSANSIFSNMVRSIFNFVRNIYLNITRTFASARATGVNTIRALYNGVKSWFGNIWQSARSMGNRVKDFIAGGFRGAYNTAKSWIKKLVDGVVGMKNDAVQAAKDLASGLKKHAIGGLNKMIDGVNWVADKLGMGSTLIEPIKFSRGTQNGALAQNTLATVGDRGPGNGQGADGRRETVVLPNGKMFLTPNIDTQMMLPKGTKIFNGRQTQEMAEGMFSRGTRQGGLGEGLGWIKDKAAGIGSKIVSGAKGLANKVGDVWDYMKNPGKLLDMALNNFGVDFSSITKIPGDLIKAGYNKLKDGALEKVKGWFEAGGLGNGKKASFMNYRMTTPYSPDSPVPGYPTGFNGGRHYGIDYGTPIGTPVNATLAGTVSKMHNKGGGLVAKLRSGNITQFFMHLKDIIKTGAVKAGEHIANTGNSGAWTTGPHIHWQAQKGNQVMNSNTINPKKVLSGHENGGFIQKGGLFNLHDNEYVVPMNNPSEAMKLIALASKKLAGKSKQTRELPNVGGSGGNDNDVVNALVEQNGILMKMLEKLTGIEAKDLSIGDEEIGQSNDRYNQKKSTKHSLLGGRPNYV
ncbi:peptidoglycan DD-metalloendopeptidase family protein [Salinicoccus halodurans]|uniref:lysostaphin n=1 Tax=Salinicoccus halodurans TaxID=407035 RepID=A0A0F7HLA4_9STAP|nr:peptidoglycan DD-metalloendopeptidase family protein [Salinicoccus halodurans]AKG74359.1 hypothetical protein AAT16_09005 [Salinicoccus halodurans]SFK94953.1 Phage-related protein [Salinicoccus halodurans]